MACDVNPREPWRPAPEPTRPPDIDPLQPWRPGGAEPAEPAAVRRPIPPATPEEPDEPTGPEAPPGRHALAEQFPTFAADVQDAERSWFVRTAEAAAAEADGLVESDPARASSLLRETYATLVNLQQHTLARDRVLAPRLGGDRLLAAR